VDTQLEDVMLIMSVTEVKLL